MVKLRVLFIVFFFSWFILVSSCLSDFPASQVNLKNAAKEAEKREMQQKIIDFVRKKKTYTGPISVKLNPHLFSEQKESGNVFYLKSNIRNLLRLLFYQMTGKRKIQYIQK